MEHKHPQTQHFTAATSCTEPVLPLTAGSAIVARADVSPTSAMPSSRRSVRKPPLELTAAKQPATRPHTQQMMDSQSGPPTRVRIMLEGTCVIVGCAWVCGCPCAGGHLHHQPTAAHRAGWRKELPASPAARMHGAARNSHLAQRITHEEQAGSKAVGCSGEAQVGIHLHCSTSARQKRLLMGAGQAAVLQVWAAERQQATLAYLRRKPDWRGPGNRLRGMRREGERKLRAAAEWLQLPPQAAAGGRPCTATH